MNETLLASNRVCWERNVGLLRRNGLVVEDKLDHKLLRRSWNGLRLYNF